MTLEMGLLKRTLQPESGEIVALVTPSSYHDVSTSGFDAMQSVP